jgi:hypothetical protein
MSLLFRQNLRQEPEPEPELEEEEEEERRPGEAAQTCMACDAGLIYTEEIFMVVVEYPLFNGREPLHLDFKHDEGVYENDFYYEPLFFEFSCWESAAHSLRKMLEDAPPVKHPAELFKCSFCESSICDLEIYGAAYIGELHVSPRMPNGEPTDTFVTIAKPDYICLGCLLLLDGDEIDLWDEELNQVGECQECSHIRCWRYEGQCRCPCHEESEE